MREKKKVLHIVEAMGGGVFTYIVELANGMCKDFDVTIAFGIRSQTPENYAEYFDQRVSLIQVNNFTRGLNPVKDLGSCFELRKIVKKVQPDIIHMHSSKAGAIGRVMFSGRKYRMFYTPHGYSFFMGDVSGLKKKVFKYIETLCGKRNCTTVACGKSEWEQIKKVSKKSTYISNGINMEKLQKIIDETGSMKTGKHLAFTVYTVGRIDYQKHPELFNRIAERLPDINFVWIGDGEMRDKLTSPNITITGWLDNKRAIRRAKQYDVFVLASRYEGLPISLLEAMYLKKTCVVSNVVGTRDVIQNNHSGYLCDNEDEFVEVIERLAKEGTKEEIVNCAYDAIVHHFNSGRLVEKYEELYSGTN